MSHSLRKTRKRARVKRASTRYPVDEFVITGSPVSSPLGYAVARAPKIGEKKKTPAKNKKGNAKTNQTQRPKAKASEAINVACPQTGIFTGTAKLKKYAGDATNIFYRYIFLFKWA